MRTTLNLDDTLLAQAQLLTGFNERSQLIREAMLALIQRESAKRLSQLAGAMPMLEPIARRGSSLV